MIEMVKSASRNIRRKSSRTLLTVIGIAVGVASVMIINTVGDAGVMAVNGELDSLGINGVSVSSSSSQYLNNDDLETLQDLACVENVSPVITASGEVSIHGTNTSVYTWGIDMGDNQILSIDIMYGRSISFSDIKSGANVCLVDAALAESYYKRKNIVGKTISVRIGSRFEDYTVVGVCSTGSGIIENIVGEYLLNFVYVPYSNMQLRYGSENLSQIAVKIGDGYDIDAASKTIKSTLTRTKGNSGSLQVNNLAKQRDRLNNLLGIVTLVLSAIGSISLLVAGLGIMTVMMVSINERTREIGIKKAIGAKKINILIEFLLEAFIISMIGSFFGILLVLILLAVGNGVGFTIQLSIKQVVITLAIAVSTALIFGVYPAMKAAKLHPVDALKQE